LITKPVPYDFPRRMRGLASARREMSRLERSIAVATERRDHLARAYLGRRHQRAAQALAVIKRREAAEHPFDLWP